MTPLISGYTYFIQLKDSFNNNNIFNIHISIFYLDDSKSTSCGRYKAYLNLPIHEALLISTPYYLITDHRSTPPLALFLLFSLGFCRIPIIQNLEGQTGRCNKLDTIDYLLPQRLTTPLPTRPSSSS